MKVSLARGVKFYSYTTRGGKMGFCCARLLKMRTRPKSSTIHLDKGIYRYFKTISAY